MTGITVLVDPRVEEKAKSANVTVFFRNDITAESALRLLADCADLKFAILPSGVYLTSPANADRLQNEQPSWLVQPHQQPQAADAKK